MKKIRVSDKWPEGVSDGLTLPCCVCRKYTEFDYIVDDNFWQTVVPKEYKPDVICLRCLDEMSAVFGLDLAEHLLHVQYIGRNKTIELIPTKTYYYYGFDIENINE